NPADAPDQPRGGTLLYDAVLCAANDVMRQQAGRKAIVILSDGLDAGSVTPLAEAVAAAQRADLLVYAIFFQSWPLPAYPPPRIPGRLPRIPFPLPLPTPPRSPRPVARRG